MPLQRVRVGTFGGASAFPVLVADRLGLFAAAGLGVETERTTDSAALREGLATGRLDVVHLAPDNVLAWRDGGAGAPALAVRAWLGGSNGPIALVAREARSVPALRGARIGVDAPGSGFAPILRRLLAAAGVSDTDAELVALGATRRRAEALASGAIDASMLTLPWSQLAADAGAVVLADHRSVASGLLTSCGASLDRWLEVAEGAHARAYASALEAAVAWLHDPGTEADATSWLADELGVGADAASAVLATMLQPELGWPVSVRLRSGALDAVWELRAEAVAPPASPADAYLRAEIAG